MQSKQQIHHSKNKHKLIFSHPKVCDAHLNRWFTLPIEITLTITPRCVPHILTGNVQSTKLQCLRQNANNADRCKHANSQPTVNACTTLHMTAKQITVVSAHKTHRHVMQQKWKQCKTHDSWHQDCSNSVSKVQILSSPNSSKTLKFLKLTIGVSSKTSKTFQNYKSIPVSARQLSAQHFMPFLQLMVVLARA